ncbi:MAG: BrnT family toxin [Methylococcales bacterium]|nr:BrnT family toxin [Methylococcales bacterium]
MKIDFDPTKDLINQQKHGVSLADTALFEWDTAVTWQDSRYDYQEPRMIGLGYIGNRLFCIVFVDRADNRRIISLRKANHREIKRYAST